MGTMWGRLYTKSRDGSWFHCGKTLKYADIEYIRDQMAKCGIPCYVEWCNAAELKWTNYENRIKSHTFGSLRIGDKFWFCGTLYTKISEEKGKTCTDSFKVCFNSNVKIKKYQ